MDYEIVEKTTEITMLLISNPTRDAIMASIHSNQGAFEALLADIRQHAVDVTSDVNTSLQEARYTPDHNAPGNNR
jgi:hypothetical protein